MKLSSTEAVLLAWSLSLLASGCSSQPGGTAPGASPALPGAEGEFGVCLVLPPEGTTDPSMKELQAGMEMAQLAIDDMVESPRRIRWLTQRSSGTEAGLAEALHRCLVDGAVATVAPSEPELALPLLPMATASDAFVIVPQLGLGTPASWGPTTIAVAVGPDEMGAVAGRDAASRGHVAAAVLRVPGDFGRAVGSAFERELAAMGGQLVGDEEIDPARAPDWPAAARRAAAAGASALFLAGPPEPAAAVAAALAEEPLRGADLWVIDWAMQKEVLAAAPVPARTRIHGVFFPPPRGVFESEYMARSRRVPSPLAGVGYEAVMLATRAVRAAPDHKPATLAAALLEAGDIQTAFGTSTVAADGEILRLGSTRRVIYEARRDPAAPDSWSFLPPE